MAIEVAVGGAGRRDLPAEWVAGVVENLRPADRAEIAAASGRTPDIAVIDGLRRSRRAFVARIDGAPAALWGVGTADMLSGLGVPWLVGTPVLDAQPLRFARASRALLPDLTEGYSRLANRVDARHRRAVTWLQWLGFTVHPASAWGVAGLPFHPFELVVRPDIEPR